MNIDKDGLEIQKSFASSTIINSIKNDVNDNREIISKAGIRGANKKFKTINEFSNSQRCIDLATSILGSKPTLVRVIYYDKTPDTNWSVAWHQDKTIAVDSKKEINGWGPWSIKDGVHHVQPPLDVLNSMVTFRLHLDDADRNNGCLKIIPKSHCLGILSQSELVDVVNREKPYLCEVQENDLLIMKPHILHSSSKSTQAKHRRVVHIEYSNYVLPYGLNWA